MKLSQAAFLLLIAILSFSFTYSYGLSDPDQAAQIDLWLVLRLRDYRTDMPISNVSITLTISIGHEEYQLGQASTNETGTVQFSLGDLIKVISIRPPNSLKLEIWGNYTLIKINESFMEDLQYEAGYGQNYTTYMITQISQLQNIFKITPDFLENLENQNFINGNLWVLKGKLIRISDCDPINGGKEALSVKPAVKAIVGKEEMSEYEGYYLFPLSYNVTIVHKVESRTKPAYLPLRVTVGENTTLINWMYHAAKSYVNLETLNMNEEMEWLDSSGFSLDREIEEYQAIENLLTRVLDLYQKGEYGPALGGARISENRLNSLGAWLSNIKNYAVLTSIGICLFVYGLASLLPNLAFDEPSYNKSRLVGKVLIFSLFILTFSLTHPSLKITYAIIIESLIGAATPSIDLPTSILGCFVVGVLTYFFITLISVKKMPMTNLALQLGVRSLKSRPSRTLLTLITITIIVSSSIIFVNISMSRATRIKESWKGTDMSGVLIRPDVNLAPLSEFDINWTRMQEWCKDLGYREKIRPAEPRDDSTILRQGILQSGELTERVDIVAVDSAFVEKHYSLSKYVRGFWQDFSEGKVAAIIPTSYDISTNDYVTLAVDEAIETAEALIPLGMRMFGDFRVIGKFDVSAVSNLTKIEGSPLFEDTSRLVLVPIKTIRDPSIVISEATIILSEGTDPVSVAEENAYTLGVPAIANKDGLAMRIEWSLEWSVTGFVPYLVPLVIAGMMVYVTMASVYEERKKEFTTLATLGLDPGNTFQVFIVEAFLLGLMGTFFGFFGSYVLVIVSFILTNLLGLYNMPTLSLSYAHWSMPAILVALFTGVVMVFLGGYMPAARAQGLSLMGRVKRRRFVGELISEAKTTSFTLPIKETVQNSEMLYTYVRETIGKFKSSLIDSHSVKGEIRRDGSFAVSFVALGPTAEVFVPCEIKGMREGESLVPVIEFPTSYKHYEKIRDILRDLERYMIGFSAWKEMQLRMKIIREAPKRRKTSEEILGEIRNVIDQIKDCNKKLNILEAQKGQLSEEVYDEFREKYADKIDELSKGLRSMVIGLEPYSSQLQEEIKKTEIQVERITTAYNLDEISEEEYVKTCGPLQGRLTTLKSKVEELEEIFEFLKMPFRLT